MPNRPAQLKTNFLSIAAVSLFLTSIRDWIYHFFVMGDVVAKLNGT